ncbi:MAG: hypothetical protein JW806_04615 [Sedimentisphaerales bacterium]|nr:hypothetical protein [Sedimentisphaerales bacterium]
MIEVEIDSSDLIKLSTRIKILVGALLITPLVIVLALISAGAGHGSYFLCKLFFPYTMLSTHLYEVITTPFMFLAVIQIPLYGLLLSITNKKRTVVIIGVIIAFLHLVAVFLCFIILMPNFSGLH